MKVIQNIELLKKLQPILERREVENYILENQEILETSELKKLPIRHYQKADNMLWYIPELEAQNFYKTLTLEEALDLLPENIWDYRCYMVKMDWLYYCWYQRMPNTWVWKKYLVDWELKSETLLEAVEQMIEYLLDNNLLWRKND